MNDDSRDDLRDMGRRIRAWTARPPSRSPGVARTRVLARLEERRARSRWRLAAATAIVALAVSGLWLLRPPSLPVPGPGGPPVVVDAAPATAGLLIYELSSGTKLYLDLASSRPATETAFQR